MRESEESEGREGRKEETVNGESKRDGRGTPPGRRKVREALVLDVVLVEREYEDVEQVAREERKRRQVVDG